VRRPLLVAPGLVLDLHDARDRVHEGAPDHADLVDDDRV